MSQPLAVSFAVHGLHGALVLVAVILFAVAAVIAWFVPPRTHWATFIAAGLGLVTLAMLVSGLWPTTRASRHSGRSPPRAS